MRSIIQKPLAGTILLLLVMYSGISFAQHSHDEHSASAVSMQDQELVNELKGKSAKQAMEIAYQWKQMNIDVVSYVTPDVVHFKFKDGAVVEVPLPDDQMVVSIAPYINSTHPCSTHYISKCDGKKEEISGPRRTQAPLRAIDGYACMLLKKHWHEFDEDSPRKFNEITANSQHLGQLINDILILSRLGKQKMSVIKLDIEVISLVEHQNKLGESTTSIFQSASMPSSGKSMHLTFLMFSSVGSAAEPPMEPR